MTGTSIDGIDAALIRITGAGLAMTAELAHHVSGSLGPLAKALRQTAEQELLSAGALARLAWDFGLLHCRIIEQVLEAAQTDARRLALICAHGQTVFHQPPISWQLLNPAPIAEQFKCPVVFDLRQADLAAGGQGAPITPIADWIMFRAPSARRAIINLGGFCNVTILPPEGPSALEQIRGFDVCPCNQILDAVARCALHAPFDDGGRAAAAGTCNDAAALRLHEALSRLRNDRRSLGTGDEALAWIETESKRMEARDLAASATEAIARCISDSLTEHHADELIVAGGGTHNRTLLGAIGRAANKPIARSDEHGVPIAAREAMAFAILGALCLEGVPITLPNVTGCITAPIAGVRTLRASV
jgi:1,6-anhydro-N-acetylmuramate kinase